ncbi:hypothetical protein PTKIN_Ptkin11bG0138200 [Pterospermum kingtungense]
MDSYHHFGNGDTLLPPGFRFHPTDEELITYYLLKKVLDSGFTARAIAEVDLNKCEPWELPGKAKMGEKEWYFFSLRDRKYPTGLRTNRATEAGYWKATGKDREIHSSKTCSLVGMKKTLVFYKGRAPKGEKSNWVMHEYRLDGKFAYHYISRSSKDEWVISRVFHKSGSGSAGTSNTGGGAKKTRISASIAPYQEPSSPSSVYLPPLLDPTATATATSAPSLTDRDSCSYDSHTQSEHVSCFSTIAAAAVSAAATATTTTILPAFNPGFDLSLPPPPQMVDNTIDSVARYSRNVGVSAFPSLRSLQENLQLPFFFSQPTLAGPPLNGGSSLNWGAVTDEGNNGSDAGVKISMGPTELDCMWTY